MHPQPFLMILQFHNFGKLLQEPQRQRERSQNNHSPTLPVHKAAGLALLERHRYTARVCGWKEERS
jgi:hypothetical protein